MITVVSSNFLFYTYLTPKTERATNMFRNTFSMMKSTFEKDFYSKRMNTKVQRFCTFTESLIPYVKAQAQSQFHQQVCIHSYVCHHFLT